MNSHVPMTLLKTVVLLHVVKVIPSDDDRTLHLHLGHNTSQDTTSDGNIAGERAFLVNVSSIDSL